MAQSASKINGNAESAAREIWAGSAAAVAAADAADAADGRSFSSSGYGTSEDAYSSEPEISPREVAFLTTKNEQRYGAP